jgi:multicomponent Na+:H+ antiporter subunit F
MNAWAAVAGALLALAGLLAVIRLIFVRGASSKAVVLDVLTTVLTGTLVLLSLVTGSAFLLDVAMIYAVLSFAAVLLVARYLERSL